jgi:hypothetical protein
LQDVEVLAIAQDIEQVNDKPTPVHVVTVLVTPDQAERLTLASGQGGLRLALRNYDDKNVIATGGVTVAQLLGAQPVAAPLAVGQHVAYAAPRVNRPKPVNVEVLRNGSSTESVSFVRSGARGNASMEAAPVEPAASSASDQAAPAGDSSKADSSDNFASAAPAAPFGAATAASAPTLGKTVAGSTTGGIGATAAPAPVLMNSGGMAGSAEPGTAGDGYGYSGPRSKTIDVR